MLRSDFDDGRARVARDGSIEPLRNRHMTPPTSEGTTKQRDTVTSIDTTLVLGQGDPKPKRSAAR